MHLKRNQIIRGLPIPKKGSKYVARARSHLYSGVPVVIAVRDMLGLAKSSREVRLIIGKKLLKINGRIVKDHNEPIKLFSIFEADKRYRLIYQKTGRFSFEEHNSDDRICKVINKKILNDGKVQINLHDGSNLISKEKINVGDSLVIDFSGKIKNKIEVEKDKNVFVISGKNIGSTGKIKNVIENKINVLFGGSGTETELDKKQIIVI